jgi:hypothetical protein
LAYCGRSVKGAFLTDDISAQQLEMLAVLMDEKNAIALNCNDRRTSREPSLARRYRTAFCSTHRRAKRPLAIRRDRSRRTNNLIQGALQFATRVGAGFHGQSA